MLLATTSRAFAMEGLIVRTRNPLGSEGNHAFVEGIEIPCQSLKANLFKFASGNWFPFPPNSLEVGFYT